MAVLFRSRFLLVFALALSALRASGASFVEFAFAVPGVAGSPYARDIRAEVALPDGTVLRAPAFYAGATGFAVRVRASQKGEYKLGRITEEVAGGARELPTLGGVNRVQQVEHPRSRPAVVRDPEDPHRFVFTDGRTYFPLGFNVPWRERGAVVPYYQQAFATMAAQRLNWSRVWMAHWGELNLDWLPAETGGSSPAPGDIHLPVAESWDRLIEAAEAHGIYLQVVLQHHGQLSTKVNSNWDEHPWNAARGGFLARPEDFFTSPEAREATRRKYRYIVARWGYSPAVLAWELFNEVHYVDAMATPQGAAAVAAWHAEMAAYLRSLDLHRHLVTTSLQDLQSAVYSAMDYVQPHIYAPNMINAMRLLPLGREPAGKPAFYGECGDEQMVLTPEQSASGVALVPPVWASLAGAGTHPGQIWFWDRLFGRNLVPELGALARMLEDSGYAGQRGLQPFDLAVSSEDTTRLRLVPGLWWERAANAEVVVPTDGREPVAFRGIPRALVGAPDSKEDGYPWQVTFQVDYSTPCELRVRFSRAGTRGASVVLTVDDRVVGQHGWAALPPAEGAAATAAGAETTEIAVAIPAGRHAIRIENTGGLDPVHLEQVDFGLPVSKLAAIGKRSSRFAYIWVWNRLGVFSVVDEAPTTATLHVPGMDSGRWRVTWWDGRSGVQLGTEEREHAGGLMEVVTPAIHRHAALVLQRVP